MVTSVARDKIVQKIKVSVVLHEIFCSTLATLQANSMELWYENKIRLGMTFWLMLCNLRSGPNIEYLYTII